VAALLAGDRMTATLATAAGRAAAAAGLEDIRRELGFN